MTPQHVRKGYHFQAFPLHLAELEGQYIHINRRHIVTFQVTNEWILVTMLYGNHYLKVSCEEDFLDFVYPADA